MADRGGAQANSILDAAAMAVEMARRHGAEQCDAFAVRYDESDVTVRLGKTEKLIEAGSRSLGLRVISGGRTAICSTTDVSPAALERLARDAVELAAISERDEHAGLPTPAQLARDSRDGLQLYDESLERMTVEEKIALAAECEAAAFAFDPRITNSDGSTLSARVGEVALANSLGFAASYPATSISLVVEVMADDEGGKKRNAHWYSSERSRHRLAAPAEVGRTAARRAIDQLGARKVRSESVPIVLEPVTAASLLRDIASTATGTALYRGATFLAGRTGEAIASPLVSLIDDPRVPARAGSRPFDGEGVATRRTPIFEAGVFRGFLFDCYTARRTGSETTGSAGRGIESLPAPGGSNLVLEAGTTAPAEIVAGVDRGLFLTGFLGFGFNPTTGDFSRGASGFWIENGRLAYPVTEVNVSGRLGDMLAGIDALGDDLTWFGSIAAPTVRINRMMVSGL